MQNLWSHATGKPKPSDYIFQGLNWTSLSRFTNTYERFFRFSDFFLSNEHWIQREGFKIRKILILKWLFLGNVITMAYKSTLLSSLITERYERPIDTIIDLERSGLPILLPSNTPLPTMFATDPRRIMQKIYNNSITYPFNGRPPAFIWEM